MGDAMNPQRSNPAGLHNWQGESLVRLVPEFRLKYGIDMVLKNGKGTTSLIHVLS